MLNPPFFHRLRKTIMSWASFFTKTLSNQWQPNVCTCVCGRACVRAPTCLCIESHSQKANSIYRTFTVNKLFSESKSTTNRGRTSLLFARMLYTKLLMFLVVFETPSVLNQNRTLFSIVHITDDGLGLNNISKYINNNQGSPVYFCTLWSDC